MKILRRILGKQTKMKVKYILPRGDESLDYIVRLYEGLEGYEEHYQTKNIFFPQAVNMLLPLLQYPPEFI